MMATRPRLLAQPSWWFAIATIVFGTLIPAYYLMAARVPAMEKLNKAQGLLVHEKVSNRRGWKVGLANGDDVTLFTCSDRIGMRHTCYTNRMKLSDHEGLEGKPATIWWYEQPIYLFTTHRRVIQLDTGDTTLISRSETVRAVDRRATRYPWIFVGVCVLVGLVIWCIPSSREPKS